MSENTGSSKKRKALSATLAVAMVATMLLSGTLAYFYRSTATNVFAGDRMTKEVVAHDDYDPETGNKDLYFENLGSTNSKVYVRVKLTEDFKYSDAGTRPTTEDGWTVHAATGTDVSATNKKYGHMEATADTTPYGEHVHVATGVGANTAKDDDVNFHDTYFQWVMGGAPMEYLSAASDIYTVEESDPKYIESVRMGGDNNTKNVACDNKKEGVAAAQAITDATEKAKYLKTTAACDGVITMADYNAKTSDDARKAFHGWVMDSDGWIYWSQPLAGGETTGLLLDKVKSLYELDDYWYEYHIHVKYEAVDNRDCGIWLWGIDHDEDTNPVVTDTVTSEAAAMLGLIGMDTTEPTALDQGNEGTAVPDISDIVPDDTRIEDADDLRTKANNLILKDTADNTLTETEKQETSAYRLYMEAATYLEQGKPRTAARLQKIADSLGNVVDKTEILSMTSAGVSEASTLTQNPELAKFFYSEVKRIKLSEVEKKLSDNETLTLTNDDLYGIYRIENSYGYYIDDTETLEALTALLDKENGPLKNVFSFSAKGSAFNNAWLTGLSDRVKAQFVELSMEDSSNCSGIIDMTGFSNLEFLALKGAKVTGVKKLNAPIRALSLIRTNATIIDVTPFASTLELLFVYGDANIHKMRKVIGLENLPNLISFYGRYSEIEEVDLRNSPNISTLVLNDTNLKTLALPNAAEKTFKNTIPEVDACIQGGLGVPTINVANTPLTTLDISKCGFVGTVDLSTCSSLTKLTYNYNGGTDGQKYIKPTNAAETGFTAEDVSNTAASAGYDGE